LQGRFLTPQSSAASLESGAQNIIKYKILRLFEPPPLQKGGQKGQKSPLDKGKNSNDRGIFCFSGLKKT